MKFDKKSPKCPFEKSELIESPLSNQIVIGLDEEKHTCNNDPFHVMCYVCHNCRQHMIMTNEYLWFIQFLSRVQSMNILI